VSAARFVIEGEWTGYRPSQQKIVHRKVYPASHKKLRAWAEKTHAIRYTDGTSLLISVRDCKPRERVTEINGYTDLIDGCARYDVRTVDDLCDAEERAKNARAAA
jgi:hypothetical protein